MDDFERRADILEKILTKSIASYNPIQAFLNRARTAEFREVIASHRALSKTYIPA